MTMLSYKDYIDLPSNKKFDYFMNTLSQTNHTPSYYVNWEKVKRDTQRHEAQLNALDVLLHQDDVYSAAMNLFTQQPQLLQVIPSLIATREKVVTTVSFDKNQNAKYDQLDFENIDTNNIKAYVDFCQNAGLLDFLKNVNRSLSDFEFGVEAGLDSNARKNRGGKTMELLLDQRVKQVCNDNNLSCKTQATAAQIERNWNIKVPVDKSERRFDEAVFSAKNNHVWLVETNYYNGGGSKLKSVCGEFITLNNLINTTATATFVWVTDGQGWVSAQHPLSEAFEQIPNIFNLSMLQDGYLYDLFQ